MDPESNIREQLSIAEEILSIQDGIATDVTRADALWLAYLAMRMAELVEALNAWLMRGGMYPAAWGMRCPDVSKHDRMRP